MVRAVADASRLAIYLMSCWYNRAELTGRIAWFYSGVPLANMVGGLIGAGVIGGLEGALGIAAWRWCADSPTKSHLTYLAKH
jgi:MFS family permease